MFDASSVQGIRKTQALAELGMGAAQMLWLLGIRFVICLVLHYCFTGDLSASLEGLLLSVL